MKTVQKSEPLNTGKDVEYKPFTTCPVCTQPLQTVLSVPDLYCHFCGSTSRITWVCPSDHAYCETCRNMSGIEFIERICRLTSESDMIRLFKLIRYHPSIPMNGPEYHSLVPAIILCAYRNLGGDVSDDKLKLSVKRGTEVGEKFCAHFGVCGAALGVGIAFSILLDATPFEGSGRQKIMQITRSVLDEISGMGAARCCQRDCFTALRKAASISVDYLDIPLQAGEKIICTQLVRNKYCFGKPCPLHPRHDRRKRKMNWIHES